MLTKMFRNTLKYTQNIETINLEDLFFENMAQKFYNQYSCLLCYLQNYMSFDGECWYCAPLGSHKRHVIDCFTNMYEVYGANIGPDMFKEVIEISMVLTKLAHHQSVLVYLAIAVELAVNDDGYLKTNQELGILQTFHSHLMIMVEKNGLKAIIKRLATLLRIEWTRVKNQKIKLLEPVKGNSGYEIFYEICSESIQGTG